MNNLHDIRIQPMLLQPVGKDYFWGGEALKRDYFKNINIEPLAETWECSVHNDGLSVVDSGEYKGTTLRDFLKAYPELMGTKIKDKKEFPILIKFIDAKSNLSIQVHPDDKYAFKNENGQKGKTEFWYVLEAKPGAELICGFEHDVTKEVLEESIKTGTLSKHLKKISVNKGDVFFIPAGTVHAIGAGIVLAEIQESSNLTYRLYDYNRVDPKNGKPRKLHFDKSCDVLNMKSGANIRQTPQIFEYKLGASFETLIRCEYFEAERIKCSMCTEFFVSEVSFQVILCLNGEGGIRTDKMDRPLIFHKGNCIFLPANCGKCSIIGKMELLKIRC